MGHQGEIKDYWEGEAGAYNDCIQDALTGRLRKNWEDIVLGYAPHEGMLDILDVGTGPGFFPIVLGSLGHKVTGIDITENMIGEARRNVAQAGTEANLLVMDGQETNFSDESFDMVLCRDITWTLDDPLKAYKEWFRVLRHGGVLLIFDGNWYTYLFDEDKRKAHDAHEEWLKNKYGSYLDTLVSSHKVDDFCMDLFMSDKDRPLWDLGHLMDMGFTKVFAEPDISDKVMNELYGDIYALTPEFIVGGIK